MFSYKSCLEETSFKRHLCFFFVQKPPSIPTTSGYDGLESTEKRTPSRVLEAGQLDASSKENL